MAYGWYTDKTYEEAMEIKTYAEEHYYHMAVETKTYAVENC